MADVDRVPADPFPPLTSIREDAAWLREIFDSLVDVGFDPDQSLRLVRDHLRWACYGVGDEPEDLDDFDN